MLFLLCHGENTSVFLLFALNFTFSSWIFTVHKSLDDIFKTCFLLFPVFLFFCEAESRGKRGKCVWVFGQGRASPPSPAGGGKGRAPLRQSLRPSAEQAPSQVPAPAASEPA